MDIAVQLYVPDIFRLELRFSLFGGFVSVTSCPRKASSLLQTVDILCVGAKQFALRVQSFDEAVSRGRSGSVYGLL
jgi:hypothetical protein